MDYVEIIDKIHKLHESGIPLQDACNTFGWTKYKYYNQRQTTGHKPPRVKRNINSKVELRWFKDINNQTKAYYLGLIASDGCIHRPNSNRSSDVLTIKLKESDRFLVDKLCSIVTPDRAVKIISNNSSLGKTCENSAYWSVNSNELVSDLLSHGINFNKSKNGLSFPTSLSKDLYRHYIRGFFDGNGYISYTPREKSQSNRLSKTLAIICTDLSFLNQISDILPVTPIISDITKKDRQINLYRLYFTKIESIVLMYYYLYSEASIYLERKFKTYSELISILGNPVLTNTLKSISNVESSG